MRSINADWYSIGRIDRKTWRPTDEENVYLYSLGWHPTKIKENELPKDYIKFRSKTIWYLIGFVRTSGVKDLYYTYIKENHLFKDDYLYISYDRKIEKIKDEYGYEEIRYFNVSISGWDSIKVLLAIEKNSKIDTTEIKNKIQEKFEWWKENEKEDYVRSFNGKNIDNIFEYYEKRFNREGD